MAVEVGTAYISILPSTDKLATAIKRDLGGVDMAREGRRQGGAYVGAMKSALAPLAGIAAGAAIGGFLKDAVSEASALGESVNALGVTYGKHSKAVEELGKNAADTLGLSNVEFNKLAVRFSGFATDIAGKGGDVVGTLDDLTVRAADFASVMDIEVADAAQTFQSALSGEFEPIKQYGITMSAATVEAHALAVGIWDGTDAMTESQKVQARYSYIMQETADTQGDFANTSDSLANVQRRLRGNMANFQAELGQKLLPVLEDLSGWAVEDGLPALNGMLDAGESIAAAFGAIPGPVRTAGAALVALGLAKHIGAFGLMRGALTRTTSAVDTMRVRMMFGLDAYTQTRAAAGRTTSAVTAMGVAATGAGTRMKAGLTGVSALVGGPWGLAIAGATTAVTMLWGEHQEAKQHADALKESLDQQTGALTDNTRETVVNYLQKEDMLDIAEDLGLSLDTVTDAALGDKDALALLNREHERFKKRAAESRDEIGALPHDLAVENLAWTKLNGTVHEQNGILAEQRRKTRQATEASGENADAVDENTDAQQKNTDALKDKIDAIREERLETLRASDVEVNYHQTLADTREELRKGKKTLDLTTQAGRDNQSAINEQVGAYHELTDAQGFSVKRYKDQRKWLIRTAQEFGMTKKEAEEYADQLLGTPKQVKTEVKFEKSKAERDAIQFKRNLNDTLAGISDRQISIDVIAKAAAAHKAAGIGPTGGASGPGGVGGPTLTPNVRDAIDKNGIVGGVVDSLKAKATDIMSAFGFGAAGSVLPKGSYRIGMPYLGYPGHYGADYPAPTGTPVRSPFAGYVTSSYDLSGSYGRFIRVQYGNGMEGLFAHLSERNVQAGQQVLAGQQIGEVGSTGNSTGPHLHYEHRRGGRTVNPATLGIFDNGGILEPGAIAVNLSRKPEAVYNHKQFQQFADAAAGNGSKQDARRIEMRITNWKDGRGYMTEIAEDTYNGEQAYAGTTRRMGGR